MVSKKIGLFLVIGITAISAHDASAFNDEELAAQLSRVVTGEQTSVQDGRLHEGDRHFQFLVENHSLLSTKTWPDEDGLDYVRFEREFLAFVVTDTNEWFTRIARAAKAGDHLGLCIGDGKDRDDYLGQCIWGDAGYRFYSDGEIQALFFESTLLDGLFEAAQQRLAAGEIVRISVVQDRDGGAWFALFLHNDYRLLASAQSKLRGKVLEYGSISSGEIFGYRPQLLSMSAMPDSERYVGMVASNRFDIVIGWRCAIGFKWILLGHPWFAGDANRNIMMRYSFDAEKLSRPVLLELLEPTLSQFGHGITEKFTRQARAADTLTIAVTDLADGETVIGRFKVSGLGGELDALDCYVQRR